MSISYVGTTPLHVAIVFGHTGKFKQHPSYSLCI